MSLYRGWAPRCYIGKHILMALVIVLKNCNSFLSSKK